MSKQKHFSVACSFGDEMSYTLHATSLHYILSVNKHKQVKTEIILINT